jgi:anti-anti-sigma factor
MSATSAGDNGNGTVPGKPRSLTRITRHGRSAEITLSGELDLADRGRLRRAVAEALAVDPTDQLVVDLSAVTFMDSAVAHWLVEAHWQSRSVGTRLVALAPDGVVRALLTELKVGEVVSVVSAR